MKEKFEKWFVEEHRDALDDDLEIDYANPLIKALWQCWQVATKTERENSLLKKFGNNLYYSRKFQ